MKTLLRLFIVFIFLSVSPAKAQHNPYLDRKAKNKPSAVMARKDKKELKRQKRAAKKQMRRSRRRVNRK